jgi:hypothetical protein
VVVAGVVASVAAAGVVASVAAAGAVVAVAVGLAAAGSVVSVFCSHAARSAAPARMQMYFFIVTNSKRDTAVIEQLEQGSFWTPLQFVL